MFKSNLLILFFMAFSLPLSGFTQSNSGCTAPELGLMLNIDLAKLRKEKLVASFAKAMGGAEVYAYHNGDKIRVITAAFKSSAGQADMNFYLQSKEDYLMEYHIVQNSNFYGEADSVVLTDEKSFYHVCDGELLSPAFGGVIDEEIFDNMKLVLDVILTELNDE